MSLTLMKTTVRLLSKATQGFYYPDGWLRIEGILKCLTPTPSPAGRDHRAVGTGSGRGAARMASFERVNTMLGNVRDTGTGTYRKPGSDHAERHPVGFARRCNRRQRPGTMILRFPHNAARTRPIPHHTLIAGRLLRMSRLPDGFRTGRDRGRRPTAHVCRHPCPQSHPHADPPRPHTRGTTARRTAP